MITHVVAMAFDQAIGKNNQLPWHLPEDLKHFKEVTMGQTVVMGTNTFRSVVKYANGKEILPGRNIIVISGTPGGITKLNDEIPQPQGVSYWTKAVLDHYIKTNLSKELLIIGGSQLYATYPPDKICATHIELAVPDADTFYNVDLNSFNISFESDDLVAVNGTTYRHTIYVRP